MSSIFAGEPVEIRGYDTAVSGMAYDSRRVEPGFLFGALSGSQVDGLNHVEQAIQKGASVILSSEPIETSLCNVVAENPRMALARAANTFFGRPDEKLQMIGITGTNGKTTVSYLVEGILARAGIACGVIGTLGARYQGVTYNTGLTTPQSVDLSKLLAAMCDQSVSAAVMEVSSHALVQHRVGGVHFDVAVFTNLTQDHLDYHHTLEAYFEAKSMLCNQRMKHTGSLVLNMDDERIASLASPGSWGFSLGGHPAARIIARSVEMHSDYTQIEIACDGETVHVRSPLVGGFNVENTLAAFGVGMALGLKPATIANGLESVGAVPGRLERVNQQGEPLVVVDYAHTPDALQKALKAIREVTQGRVICVFGCGGDRDGVKRGPMGEAVAKGADVAIVTNDNPRGESPQAIADMIVPGLERGGMQRGSTLEEKEYTIELDRSLAIELAVRTAKVADAVLIAGKGHEDYQIVGTEKRSFDDRVAARTALTAWPS